MIFGIRNKKTKVVMILSYENETHGREYMTYERPTFSIEEPREYSAGSPIWTTNSIEIAERVIRGEFNGEEDIQHPSITKGWTEGDLNEYEVCQIHIVESSGVAVQADSSASEFSSGMNKLQRLISIGPRGKTPHKVYAEKITELLTQARVHFKNARADKVEQAVSCLVSMIEALGDEHIEKQGFDYRRLKGLVRQIVNKLASPNKIELYS